MKLAQLGIVVGASLLLAINNLGAQELDAYKLQQYLERGDKYHKQGKYKQAAEEYKIAWEEGQLLDALYNLAEVYDFQLNNNELAIQYYSEYITADPYSLDIDEIKQLREKAVQDLSREVEWREGLKRKTPQTQPAQAAPQEITTPPDPPPPDEEGFNEGLARACLSCHAGFLGPKIDPETTHPVGRIPKGELAKTVPAHVRFYKEGKVICLSCHDPQNIHFEQGTPGKTYKVLRVDTGPDGEEMSRFCAMCHPEKSADRYLRELEQEGETIRRE